MNEKLSGLTVAALREMASKAAINGFKTMKKAELIEALENLEQASTASSKSSVSKKKVSGIKTKKEKSKSETAVKASSEKTKTGATVKESSEKTKSEAVVKEKTGKKPPRKPVKNDNPDAKIPATPENREPAPVPVPVPETPPPTFAGFIDIKGVDSFGFLRESEGKISDDDVYISASQIKKFGLRNGDFVEGITREPMAGEKYKAIIRVLKINNIDVENYSKVIPFEKLIPVFPHEKFNLETKNEDLAMRVVDLLSPIGKGQRGLIVAQPKVGKTTLLKKIAKSLLENHPEIYLMILLIDERPEEVTDMKESIQGANVEIAYSTFDESPENHKKVAEQIIEKAKRKVEAKQDVVILLDSITRLTRAYNLTITSSGRTLSGGLDPAALYEPKRFFGSARCMKEGGSLTILATALTETGSRLDDMVYEEFKGTGNMELVLDRRLSDLRIFPAIDILKSSTRRDDLLLSPDEQMAVKFIHHTTTNSPSPEKAVDDILKEFNNTKDNAQLVDRIKIAVKMRNM